METKKFRFTARMEVLIEISLILLHIILTKSQNVSHYQIHTCILAISTFYANALGKWGSLFTKMHPLVVAASHSSSISPCSSLQHVCSLWCTLLSIRIVYMFTAVCAGSAVL